MFCIENNDPTSAELTRSSCICPGAGLSATTDDGSVEEKTLCKTQNSALIRTMFFCVAKSAWCGWRRVGGLPKGASRISSV